MQLMFAFDTMGMLFAGEQPQQELVHRSKNLIQNAKHVGKKRMATTWMKSMLRQLPYSHALLS